MQDPFVLAKIDGETHKIPAVETISTMVKLYETYSKDGVIDAESMKTDLEQTQQFNLKLFERLLLPFWQKQGNAN